MLPQHVDDEAPLEEAPRRVLVLPVVKQLRRCVRVTGMERAARVKLHPFHHRVVPFARSPRPDFCGGRGRDVVVKRDGPAKTALLCV